MPYARLRSSHGSSALGQIYRPTPRRGSLQLLLRSVSSAELPDEPPVLHLDLATTTRRFLLDRCRPRVGRRLLPPVSARPKRTASWRPADAVARRLSPRRNHWRDPNNSRTISLRFHTPGATLSPTSWTPSPSRTAARTRRSTASTNAPERAWSSLKSTTKSRTLVHSGISVDDTRLNPPPADARCCHATRTNALVVTLSRNPVEKFDDPYHTPSVAEPS